jgi:hypothetical protein
VEGAVDAGPLEAERQRQTGDPGPEDADRHGQPLSVRCSCGRDDGVGTPPGWLAGP